MSEANLKNHLAEAGFLWGPELHPYPVSGLMSYGPAGKKLKTNLEEGFAQIFSVEDFEAIETPVFLPTEAWQASGHYQEFENEMFHTQTSSGRSLSARPEIATTIYPLFNQLYSYYGKMPFRTYQMGPVMPNDKQTQWQTRTRQYTAHEGHIFSEKGEHDFDETIEYLANLGHVLMEGAGLSKDTLIFREKVDEAVPFYATKAYGMYTNFKDGKELELLGIQYRSSRDFESHSMATGKKLRINGEFPEVYEISFSTDRPFLAVLERSLGKISGHAVLQLPVHLAPILAAVAPLKNTPPLSAQVPKLYKILRSLDIDTRIFDVGPIGSRYRKADTLGIPYVFTIDKAEDEGASFTIRNRDTRAQTRVKLSHLEEMASLGTLGLRSKFDILKNLISQSSGEQPDMEKI